MLPTIGFCQWKIVNVGRIYCVRSIAYSIAPNPILIGTPELVCALGVAKYNCSMEVLHAIYIKRSVSEEDLFQDHH